MKTRHIMALLLVGTGIAHIGLFLTHEGGPTRIPVGVFGLAYFLIGSWILGSRTARAPVLTGGLACGAGFLLGTAGAILTQFTPLGTFLLGVDVAVVVLSVILLRSRPESD